MGSSPISSTIFQVRAVLLFCKMIILCGKNTLGVSIAFSRTWLFSHLPRDWHHMGV